MSAACSREEISECRGLGVVSGEDLTRQGREGHFVDPGRPAGRDRRRGAARISWIGELEDLERAVAVTGVKRCDPSRGDRQNAIRAGNAVVGGGWGGGWTPAKPAARPISDRPDPEKISTPALERSAIKMSPSTGSAKLMSNALKFPLGFTKGSPAGTGTSTGVVKTTSATAGPAAAAIATTLTSPSTRSLGFAVLAKTDF